LSVGVESEKVKPDAQRDHLKLNRSGPLHPQLLRGLMNSGKSIFAQLMDFLHAEAFRRCVKRLPGPIYVHAVQF
jgi:hypothetical protein